MEEKEMILNKSRDIIMTNYDITAVENRMYNHILYKSQKEKNSDVYKCKLTREEIINKIIKHKDDQVKQVIENVFDTLQSTKLVFWERKNNVDIKKDYNLIMGREYKVQEDTWEISIPEVIYEHLTKYYSLAKCYAPLNLQITSKFKSFYAQRMYELLRLWSRYNKTIEHKFSLEEIRFVLGAEHKYPQYKNFKQSVLNTCKKELAEKANMIIDFEEIKTERRVTHLLIKVVDGEPKKYFRDFKIGELREDLNLSDLNSNTKSEIESEICELEINSQDYSQEVFESKFNIIKERIDTSKLKVKDIKSYFDKATFDLFKLEYNLKIEDENIKIKILDCISRTTANTDFEKIYSKNYEYFKTILSQNYNIQTSIQTSCNDKVINEENKNDKNNEENMIKIERFKEIIQLNMKEISYKTWIFPLLNKAHIDKNILYLVYEDDFVAEIVKSKFDINIINALKLCNILDYKLIKKENI